MRKSASYAQLLKILVRQSFFQDIEKLSKAKHNPVLKSLGCTFNKKSRTMKITSSNIQAQLTSKAGCQVAREKSNYL